MPFLPLISRIFCWRDLPRGRNGIVIPSDKHDFKKIEVNFSEPCVFEQILCNREDMSKGFTIFELIIVMAIIGILALSHKLRD